MDNDLQDIQKVLKERLDILPMNLYQVLFNDTTQKNIKSLTDLLSITEVEKVYIENQITLMLLMYLPVDLFSSKITNETLLTDDQAKNVLTQFLNSLPSDVQSDLKLISEDLLEAYEESPEASAAMKKNSLSHLEQNFKSLREEAMHSSELENTPIAAAMTDETIPENLPTVETPEAMTLAQEAPTITIPHAHTKTSYTVEPMRTMATDVTRVHGYGAYRDLFPDEAGEQTYKEEVIKAAPQEELLQEKPKLAEKPTYGGD